MEEQAINPEQLPEPAAQPAFRYFPFFNRKQPVFVLVLMGIIFYSTSLYNEYALDDGIVIHQNSYVLKGVAGIKDIVGRDLYDSFYRRMHAVDQLQGGRYHPLPVVTFALEQELIGYYRTGYYNFVEDLNHNGVLDPDKVVPVEDPKINSRGSSYNFSTSDSIASSKKDPQPPLSEYEYNNFTDVNLDGVAQENECNNCWDTNRNFHNDPYEDLNEDGIFNEVDCQVRGAMLRHFTNLFAYILACVFLYLLFKRYFFKSSPDMAFLAALIFLVHPLHSEVVANVKGRDEIFSVLFIALTFLLSFKFIEDKKPVSLLWASVMLLLALLSKEYGILLLFLMPLAMHVFNKEKIDHITLLLLGFIFLVLASVMVLVKLRLPEIPGLVLILGGLLLYPILVPLLFRKKLMQMDLNTLMAGLFSLSLFYLGLRLNAVSIAPGVPDTEILNNPYLLATGEEKFATKIFIFIKYLWLAVFPVHLRSDYSYDTIAYRHYTDFSFILSALLNLSLLVSGIVLTVRRHVLGFAIIAYYTFLLLVSNLFFEIGAIMHEGFMFHPSIGVAMAMAWLIVTGFEKIRALSFAARRSILLSGLVLFIFLCCCKTWERNWDWKNDVTLFLKDVKTTPNSVLVLGNAGARWIDLADTREITGILAQGQNPYLFNDYNGTLKITDEELREGGYQDKREAALYKGMCYLKHAVELHPRYVNGYLNLGLASFKLNKDRDVIYYWKIAEALYPQNPYLENYYRVYTGILKARGDKAYGLGDMRGAAEAYNMRAIVLPKDPEAWFDLGTAYYMQQRYGKAKKAYEKVLKLNPADKETRKILLALPPE